MASPSVYSMMTFTELYPRLLADCRRLARRILTDDDLAGQIAAEALLRLYEHWDEIDSDPGHQRAWALRVTRNLAVDEVRRQVRQQPLADTDTEALDASAELLLRMILLDALADLPAGQRRAIQLRYLQDLSQSDVADALGVKPGTVATHTTRAFATLRQRLADEAPKQSHTPQEIPTMKINNLDQAKRLIGTSRTVTAELFDGLGKGRIQASIGIPAVYQRRGQLPITGSDESSVPIECVVIDMYDDQRPLVTNAPGAQAASLNDRINDLQPGQHVTGIVTTVLPFGAFVQFDGLRGLIHTSDLDPNTALTSGRQVEVEIAAVDTRLARIGLRPTHR